MYVVVSMLQVILVFIYVFVICFCVVSMYLALFWVKNIIAVSMYLVPFIFVFLH